MNVTKLAAADQPREFYKYTVEGVGYFPFEMLRYDSAWPAGSEAVSRLPQLENRCIRLCSYRPPTVDRWRSFGWIVQD